MWVETFDHVFINMKYVKRLWAEKQERSDGTEYWNIEGVYRCEDHESDEYSIITFQTHYDEEADACEEMRRLLKSERVYEQE